MKKYPRLNHIALNVFDLKKSAAFYREIIGLDSMPEPFKDGKHAWFTIGQHSQLHIIAKADSVQEHNKTTHICFSVSSIENFILILKKNNIPFENAAGTKNFTAVRPDGVKQIYFKDPDGYWIEINNDTY